MGNFVNLIKWILSVMFLPLGGSIIVKNIFENNFDLSFWILVVIYVVLCICVGFRLYLFEEGEDD